jgi:hypothetical protein
MSHPSHSFCFDDPNDIGSLIYVPNFATSCPFIYRTNVGSALTQVPNKWQLSHKLCGDGSRAKGAGNEVKLVTA